MPDSRDDTENMQLPEEASELTLGPAPVARDFPLSRAEKVDLAFIRFDEDIGRQTREHEELKTKYESLHRENALLRAEVARYKLAVSDAKLAPAIRRKTCVFMLPEEEANRAQSQSDTQLRAPRQTAPPLGSGDEHPTEAIPSSSPPQMSSSFSPPGSPSATALRQADGRAAPPVPRRRRRTTVFRLPPEADQECAEGSQPMRAKRRTAPPTAAALAAAQAAGDEMAAVAKLGTAPEERISSFTPQSSPQLTPRSDGLRSPRDAHSAQQGLDASATTPDRQHCPGPVGSITAVQWSGEEAVAWLRLAPREMTDDWLAMAAQVEEQSGQSLSGEVYLDRGEYITAMRGRAETYAGRAAEWVIVVTSTMRSITLGCEPKSVSEVPSFSWVADEGNEIFDVSFDSYGYLCGFQQRELSASEST